MGPSIREFFKAVCVVSLLVAIPAAALAWFDDRPNETTWLVRYTAPAITILALGAFLKLHFGRDEDKVPDWLRRQAGEHYFTQSGFGFAIQLVVIDGVLHFEAWFQNQYERPCEALIALKPARGFFMSRSDIEEIRFEIACGPAAFGVARLPVPLRRELHGKRQEFEVRAEREYPEGKGKRLRFNTGVTVGAESAMASNSRAIFSGLAPLAGVLVWHRSARATFTLPQGAAEELPSDVGQKTATLWRLGDSLDGPAWSLSG